MWHLYAGGHWHTMAFSAHFFDVLIFCSVQFKPNEQRWVVLIRSRLAICNRVLFFYATAARVYPVHLLTGFFLGPISSPCYYGRRAVGLNFFFLAVFVQA